MIARVAVAAVGLALLAMPVRLAAQDSLASARQLYASAEYNGALTTLDNLLKANPPAPDRQAIDLYRTFCLVALGRMDEAKTAVDAMITRDPLYHPDSEEVPPRLQTLFRDARKRLLPTIIQQRYVAAKAAFDRNEHKAAAEGFTQVLLALSDPEIGPVASQPPLSDLKVLAIGFNDLTMRALTPPATPTPPAPTPAATSAPSSPATSAPAPASVAATPTPTPATSGPASSAASRGAPEIFTAESRDIVEPAVVKQQIPPYPGRIVTDLKGVLEIIIDETGAVESAVMLQPIDLRYNRLVLDAAKTWVYRPARRNGAPVKYLKRIQITMAPDRPR